MSRSFVTGTAYHSSPRPKDVGFYAKLNLVGESGQSFVSGGPVTLEAFAVSTAPIPPALAAADLPASRSGQTGDTATAFATMINTGSTDAVECSIALPATVLANFSYQTTDPATNSLVGTPNTPANIPVGQSQSYIFAFAPTAEIPPTDVELAFDCTNTDAAPVVQRGRRDNGTL